MARDFYELTGLARFSLKRDIPIVAFFGLAYVAYSIGLIEPSESAVKQPTFEQAAAAAQAKADARNAQAEAARQDSAR
jgi:hypothetical protein